MLSNKLPKGESLRTWRHALARLDQQTAAKILGKARSTYNRIEQGKTKEQATLMRLAGFVFPFLATRDRGNYYGYPKAQLPQDAALMVEIWTDLCAQLKAMHHTPEEVAVFVLPADLHEQNKTSGDHWPYKAWDPVDEAAQMGRAFAEFLHQALQDDGQRHRFVVEMSKALGVIHPATGEDPRIPEPELTPATTDADPGDDSKEE